MKLKRPILGLIVSFLLIFGGITVLRVAHRVDEETSRTSDKAEELRKFWEAYERATKARVEEDYAGATSLYREALGLDPTHEDSMFYLAVSLQGTGRYEEAAAVLRQLTTRNPESGRGWSQLGRILATRAPGAPFDPEGARDAFERSEALNQEHSGPFLSEGFLALELGDDAEAKHQFEIAADMGSPEGSFQVGLIAFRNEDYGEAVRWFSRVLEASEHENAIAGRGASSEGDVELEAKLTPLESARIRALVFLYWTSRRMGGYEESVPERRRIQLEDRGVLRALRVKTRVFRHDDPQERLEERRAALPPTLDLPGTWVDAAAADVDGDGEQDLFLLGWRIPGKLLLRRGSSFEDRTEAAGLRDVGGEGLSAIFLDYDSDSDPDLLVTAHAPLALSLRRLLAPEHRAHSLTPRLFRNDRSSDGRGKFVEVTSEVGLDRQFGVVEARAIDVDGDGFLDLIFAMGGLEAYHLEPSVVLRNHGGKSFEEWAHLPSIDEPTRALGVEASNGAIELLVAEDARGRRRR